jgi:hypothetical protein
VNKPILGREGGGCDGGGWGGEVKNSIDILGDVASILANDDPSPLAARDLGAVASESWRAGALQGSSEPATGYVGNGTNERLPHATGGAGDGEPHHFRHKNSPLINGVACRTSLPRPTA